MSTLLEKLKKDTAAAIQRGQQEMEMKRQLAAACQRQIEEEQQRQADEILQKVPNLCKKAAANGQNWCDIARVEYESKLGMFPRCSSLEGMALKLYKGLLQLGFTNVDLTYDHDGIGLESWYMLRVKW